MKCNSYGGDYLLFIDYTLIWIVHDDNNDDEDVKEGVEEDVYFSPPVFIWSVTDRHNSATLGNCDRPGGFRLLELGI